MSYRSCYAYLWIIPALILINILVAPKEVQAGPPTYVPSTGVLTIPVLCIPDEDSDECLHRLIDVEVEFNEDGTYSIPDEFSSVFCGFSPPDPRCLYSCGVGE